MLEFLWGTFKRLTVVRDGEKNEGKMKAVTYQVFYLHSLFLSSHPF